MTAGSDHGSGERVWRAPLEHFRVASACPGFQKAYTCIRHEYWCLQKHRFRHNYLLKDSLKCCSKESQLLQGEETATSVGCPLCSSRPGLHQVGFGALHANRAQHHDSGEGNHGQLVHLGHRNRNVFHRHLREQSEQPQRSLYWSFFFNN